MSEGKIDFKNYIDNIISEGKEPINIELAIDYMDIFNYDLPKRNQILKEIYSYNLRLTKELDKEVASLSQIGISTSKEMADIKLIEPIVTNVQKSALKTYEPKQKIDISNYIEMIDSYNENNNYEYLIQMIDKQNILTVINQLIAYYTLEYVTLKRLKKEDKNSTVILEEERRIKNILNNLYNCRNAQTQTNTNLNKLIYLTKAAGNINFLDSLDGIPSEQYQDVYNAFLSIYNGTFKDSKQLSKIGNDYDEPLMRVRVGAIRIYYLQITPDLYLIVDTEVKKIVNSNRYGEYIHRISKSANVEKTNFLKLNRKDQEKIISEHELVTQDIISKLSPKKKVLK